MVPLPEVSGFRDCMPTRPGRPGASRWRWSGASHWRRCIRSWREVYALLERAALQTNGLSVEHPPSVLQRDLHDFYVQYELLVAVAPGESRSVVLSRLMEAIQDEFNEAGVQIMSPHFQSQPDEKVTAPRGSWFPKPPEQSASKVREPR